MTTVVDVVLEKDTHLKTIFLMNVTCVQKKNRKTLNTNAELAAKLSAVFVVLLQTLHQTMKCTGCINREISSVQKSLLSKNVNFIALSVMRHFQHQTF